jgi:hypothetical protein
VGRLLQSIQGLLQAADQVGVSRIRKASRLAAVDCLSEGAMEKSVLHIELLNRLVMGNSNGEYRAHSGWCHNRAERLIIVHTGALSETPEDPTSLVTIEGAVGTKLVGEDPFAGDDVRATRLKNKFPGPVAHEGPILIFHCRTSIRIGERGSDRGWDRRRQRGGEGEWLRSHLKAILSPRDGQHHGLTAGRLSGQRRRCQRWYRCRL